MSNALAIAGVSAVLQFYLNNLYSNLSAMFGGTITVTAQAPDLVQNSFANLTSLENQVNLFLHQVTYNQAYRNVSLPSLAADGITLRQSPPLALDLHYLLTVYGTADWQAEGLLGNALMMFHQNPIIARADITYALNNLPPKNNLSSALANCGLADQFEMIKITPATLGREEMAWLWTALKADYRPTFPFQVSVVLMQPDQNASLALPVLYRQFQAVVSQPAQLLAVLPPNNQQAFQLTDPVTVNGEFLSTVTQVELVNSRLGIQFTVPVSNVTATSFTCSPGAQTTYPNGIPAGIYLLKAQILAPNSTPAAIVIQQSTNELPVALAPTLVSQAVTLNPNPDGTPTVLVTIDNISPGVFEGQNVVLALSSQTAPLPPGVLYSISSSLTTPPLPLGQTSYTSLTFEFPNTLPAGQSYLGRLVVDGVSSVVSVNWNTNTPNPPVFTGPMVTT
ncbi:MAG: DUF4255 domain-containing protein [Terracidiphilus sp.]|jgi:hypothetical protein